MSCPITTQNLDLCLQINDETIYNFCGKVNEDILIQCTKDIEALLKEHGAKPSKIKNVFELVVETLQNMLHYSCCSTYYKKDKKESLCNFTLSYNSDEDSYIIDSCNLIESYKKDIIEQRVQELNNLSKKELRKLALKKIRTQKDRHNDGAGLGFIMMAKKTIKPIQIEFRPYSGDILHYKQRLVI